jgi:hypothetical protein
MDDEKTLLWAAVEDYAGLWTAPWELRALHPEQSSQDLVARARPILGRFLEGGLIHLYSCQEPDGEPILIDDLKAAELLEAEESWDEPSDDWLVTLFSATPEGEAAYKGMF